MLAHRSQFHRLLLILAALCIAPLDTGFCLADGSLPTTRPLLSELDQETRGLFRDVAPSIVRVELPAPAIVSISPTDPLAKWIGKLDPQSLQQWEDFQRHATGNAFIAEIRPATRPFAVPTEPARLQMVPVRVSRFAPNSMGIVLDTQGHLLVPRFTDKFAAPVPLVIGNGKLAFATFVGSDRQADVTVLQLQSHHADPASIADKIPESGALILVLSLNPAMNRLAVWEGWEPDAAALVTIDGRVAGFTKGGRFLSACACKPVVDELIDHGSVRRAFLGVVIQTVSRDDPLRRIVPALSTTPALRILAVVPGSAAAQAGLQPGDLILTLAGQSVGDNAVFGAAIANRRGKTEMQLLRDGHPFTVTVDLQVQ